MTLLTPRLSIRMWLILLVLAFVLPLGTLFIQHLIVEEEAARAAAYANVQELARSTAARLELTLRDHEAMLSLIATEFRGNPPVRARRFQPAQFMDIHTQVINLAVHDLHANNIYSYLSSPVSAEIALQFPWFQQALRAETFTAGDAFFGYLSGRWVSVWCYPVYGEDGVRTGIVSASIDLLRLNARLLTVPAIPTGFSVAILDQEGKFLLRSIEPEKWIGQPGPDVGPGVDVVQWEGNERMVAFVTLPDTGWRVVAGVPEAQALAGYRARRDQGLALVLAIMLLVLALAWRIASAIANPIRALAETSRKVAEGDTTVRALPAGPAEVEAVARQFNRMLGARAQVDSALRESESRWKFALESAGDGVWDWNIPSGTMLISANYEAMLGFESGSIQPTIDAWVAMLHPDDVTRAKDNLQDYLGEKLSMYEVELRMRCKSGTYKWVLCRGNLVSRDNRGAPLRMVGIHTDITDRKYLLAQRLSEELILRNALVREVHHRVKNSLQGVVGILREFGRNHPETMEPISQAVGQVQSIALIHGLQGRSTLDQVRLCELTAEVAAGIDSLWHTSINVAIPAQWVPCLITAAEAVPVALVLNELILNAVKHGDPAYGGVQVTLQKGDLPCIVRICIMNGGMWKSVTGGAHVGLQLVDSLMPRDGAKLIRVLHSDSTCTTLELGPPVISLEIIESI